MAEPVDSYPATATNGTEEPRGDGEQALRDALAENGEQLAAVVESSDELQDVLTTAILIVASADEDELDHITDSITNLTEAADGISTAEAAALATDVGANAEELSSTLSTLLELERSGDLETLVTLATAVSGGLSPDEVDELASLLESDTAELIDALDLVLELQREGDLGELLDLAQTASRLELDEDAVTGLNAVLGAVGEAQRNSHSRGILGLLGQLRTRDARSGLGYLVALLKALGRRVR